jgi:hypothetical protein
MIRQKSRARSDRQRINDIEARDSREAPVERPDGVDPVFDAHGSDLEIKDSS